MPVSSFGFVVAGHPREPGTVWFAPAEADQRRVPVEGAVAVNRSRDGGCSFETLRRSLPQQHAHGLVYRHGPAVTDDGRHPLMGSTTGGLWPSADAGEPGHTVSQALPPIFALRLG